MPRVPALGITPFALLIATAMPLGAQVPVDEEPAWLAVDLRYSRTATELTPSLAAARSDRENSVGLMVAFELRRFIAGFRYEHDFDNLPDLIGRAFDFDSAGFSRDRFELTAGYAFTPSIAVEGGVRNERIIFDPTFAAENLLESGAIEYGAAVAGVRVRTRPEQRFGFDGSVRAYLGGSAWHRERLTDTSGYRAEAGFPIRFSPLVFRIVPGIAWEHLQTGQPRVELDAWRVFVSFGLSGLSDSSHSK